MTGAKQEKSASILVVDDNPTIRRVLEQYLEPNGYSVFLAENGEKGIRIARESVPDLVLLDIMMPGMDGFEICAHLKEDPHTRDITVLFITTLSDVEVHKRAIECGGQGFITKPFSEDLLNAYVRTFLEKKRSFDELGKKAEWQNRFMNMGIHDLNNLLFGISSNLELAMLEESGEDKVEKRIERSLFTLRCVVEMVRNFQEMLKLGSSEYQLKADAIDMRKLLERGLSILESEMQLKGLGFVFRGPRKCEICGDRDLLERVMMDFLENAVKFARAGTELCFEIENNPTGNDKGRMEFVLTNQCAPLLPEYRKTIFEMFRQGPQIKERERGKGIGLSFCKSAIEKEGGNIWIESPLKGQSGDFGVHFTLPDYPCS